MKLFTQGRYATVASTAALVVALGGTSYAAAGLITGQDIKNGTVTTADVKNHNLKLKDFSSGARSGLTGATGATGATGPAGPQGVQGVQGPIGPSNAYSVFNDNSTVMAGGKVVLSLALQPGAYVVSSKTLGVSTNLATDTWYSCTLAGGGASDFNGADAGNNALWSNVENQIVISTAAPATITLTCSGNATNVSWKKMTAVKVGSVSNNPGPDVAKVAGSKLHG